MVHSLGYALSNTELSNQKPKVYIGRQLSKDQAEVSGNLGTPRTLAALKAARASNSAMNMAADVSMRNTADLLHLFKWNALHSISIFRLPTELIPYVETNPCLQFPAPYSEIHDNLKKAGRYALQHGFRITTRASFYVKLCTLKAGTYSKSMKRLHAQATLLSLMGGSPIYNAVLSMRMGASYANKARAADVFCRHYAKLPPLIKQYLVLENESTPSLFSTKDLYDLIHIRTKIPIMHDMHHHTFNDGGISQEAAIKLASSTWPGFVRPLMTYSESLSTERGDSTIAKTAHSKYVVNKINTFGQDADIILEATAHEQAVLKYNALWQKQQQELKTND